MSKCVLVRDFSPAETVSPEVSKHVEALKGLGFTVLWGHDKPALRRVSEVPSRDVVAGIVASLTDDRGLSLSGIASLVGSCKNTVLRWKSKAGDISPESWKRLKRLSKRADSVSESELKAEARGASRSRSLSRIRNARTLTPDDRLEIAARRERGDTSSLLANEYGVTPARICQIVNEVKRLTTA